MAQKQILKVKKEPTLFDLGIPLYFSGFCLTDQFNFAEFYVDKIPKVNYNFGKLRFVEKDLQYVLGDLITFKENGIGLKIKDFYINKFFYLYFLKKYKTLKFYWLKEFLKQPAYRKIAVVEERTKKLIGILIAKTKKELENGI